MIKSLELQRHAHQLLFFEDDAPVYSDDFCQQNRAVLTLSDTLYSHWIDQDPLSSEEEAQVCLSLLMGYNASIYDNGNKQERIQQILDRSWKVLEQLSASLLKVRLLTYCYAEVFDEDLAAEVSVITEIWKQRELTPEECEVIELLDNLKANPYPWCEVEE